MATLEEAYKASILPRYRHISVSERKDMANNINKHIRELCRLVKHQEIERQSDDGGWWPTWKWGQYEDVWPMICNKLGTDIDLAQVLTQNRVAIAEAKLPAEVKMVRYLPKSETGKIDRAKCMELLK